MKPTPKFVIHFGFAFLMPFAYSAPEERIDIQTINRDIQKWVGKEATVRGKVIHVDPEFNSFVIDGDKILNDQLLVIVNPKLVKTVDVKLDDEVTVQGTIRNLKIREIKQKYKAALDPKIEVELIGTRPSIVSREEWIKVDQK